MHAPASLPPLLKWPGGKRALVPQITEHLPQVYGRYYEPFAGGAALFFHLRPARAVLSDVNPELVNFYRVVRDEPDELIRRLLSLENSESAYYETRRSKPESDVECAARLLYLMTLSFNGIYRENRKGEFNVPYGRRTHRAVCDPHQIREAARALSGVEIRSSDFAAACRDAAAGDLVYFDPPYTLAHNNNGFVKYNAKLFSWEDQERLATLARELVDRGCHVVVSNAAHSSVEELYPKFTAVRIERRSAIAASAAHRSAVEELILVGKPTP